MIHDETITTSLQIAANDINIKPTCMHDACMHGYYNIRVYVYHVLNH